VETWLQLLALPPARRSRTIEAIRRGSEPADGQGRALDFGEPVPIAPIAGDCEKRHFREPSTPADRLSELIASRGMKPSEIRHVFGSGNVYDVMKGKRVISKRAAK